MLSVFCFLGERKKRKEKKTKKEQRKEVSGVTELRLSDSLP
jgi:hypothetical protein